MDKHELTTILQELDTRLASASDIIVIGGAAIMHHVSTFRPDWAQKIRYFLQEQGWPID